MSPEITITSEELRERVEDHLDRWIPDTVRETEFSDLTHALCGLTVARAQ
mgnify:CR=1 FL=1